MSDRGFDNVLAGLDDEQPEGSQEATKKQPVRGSQKARKARTRKAEGAEPRPKREAGQSEQRGARKKPEYLQINTNIRRSLHASLFYYLKAERTTLSAVVEELLERWVDERGGEFVPAKPKRGKNAEQ